MANSVSYWCGKQLPVTWLSTPGGGLVVQAEAYCTGVDPVVSSSARLCFPAYGLLQQRFLSDNFKICSGFKLRH